MMARTVRRGSFKGKVAHNSTQQRNKASSYGYLMLPRSVPIFKEEGGTRAQLDILPYIVTDERHPDHDAEYEVATKGSLWYRRPYKLHRNVGAENNAVVCPTSIGKKCPICEYRSKLLNEGTSWKDDSIRALRASDRNLYYVVPKGDKKHDDKPHIWDISQFLFQAKLNDELEENEEYETFPDLEDGFTLRIRFSEEKLEKNTYAETSRIDFAKRDYTYEESDIEKLPSLDDILVVKDYKELEREFFETGESESTTGGGSKDDDTDQKDEVTVRTRPVSRSAASSEKEPEKQRSAPITRGKRPEKDDEETETQEEREPEVVETETQAPVVPRTTRERPKPARDKDDKCPHGHKFGIDCDKKPDCEDCKVWGECMDAMEAATA